MPSENTVPKFPKARQSIKKLLTDGRFHPMDFEDIGERTVYRHLAKCEKTISKPHNPRPIIAMENA
ncbi:hypothetical protein [uncultured Fibrobacter sp.]|uniref:hypothetical protein n=1 Tax=uncultured Fibrobacter sp. TaxID=261512 RepID=UPI0028039871|nr:hypothetical protein [uncultured Fibrobacter sp.]